MRDRADGKHQARHINDACSGGGAGERRRGRAAAALASGGGQQMGDVGLLADWLAGSLV
jgi:hypothetical protein